MAAILRANTISVPDEDEEKEDDEKQKRVMFKTPSPVIVQVRLKFYNCQGFMFQFVQIVFKRKVNGNEKVKKMD